MFRRAALALCLAAAACGGSGDTVEVTLEVRDGWVREPDAECAGSIPFLYVHRGGPYRVEADRGGRVVSSGTLPPGRAVEAVNEDLGVPRVPTFCRFRFAVEVPGPGDYRLELEEGSPLEFEVGDAPRPVILVIP